tara:strand:- start:282 stop:533 length:252 start_codon:yes stop_codon:yes gene_type:complete
MENKEEIKHAFYSETQKKNISRFTIMEGVKESKTPISSVYLNVKGEQIEVTEICPIKDETHKERFNDSVYKGVVVKWYKSIYQ